MAIYEAERLRAQEKPLNTTKSWNRKKLARNDISVASEAMDAYSEPHQRLTLFQLHHWIRQFESAAPPSPVSHEDNDM